MLRLSLLSPLVLSSSSPHLVIFGEDCFFIVVGRVLVVLVLVARIAAGVSTKTSPLTLFQARRVR